MYRLVACLCLPVCLLACLAACSATEINPPTSKWPPQMAKPGKSRQFAPVEYFPPLFPTMASSQRGNERMRRGKVKRVGVKVEEKGPGGGGLARR
ncbi:hypothetical protein V1478_004521 [Vespula squamosa]|uniref:Secreted protein n=1 Tax=Vespula squamosa TaxID=30214 RepID=A0ABD2BGF3_VESSQ